MSIYSWSIGHILEHEFFCLGCLGWAEVRKKSGLKFFWATFEGVFSTFWGQKKWFFFWKHCRKFPHFFDIFDDFVYCWTFEIFHLHICLLLNLWTFFTTEPLRLSVAAESLDFLYCWTFEIICCCWTFGFSLLLNLWIFFTTEHFRLCPELCICWMLKLWERSAVNKITKKVDP